MEPVTALWQYLPSAAPASVVLASPALWDSLDDGSDSTTLTLAVSSRVPRIRRGAELEYLQITVRQASKVEVREVAVQDLPERYLLVPEPLATAHRQVFGSRPPPTSPTSPLSLHLCLSRLLPLTSVIFFALDSTSYDFSSQEQAAFVDRLANTAEVVREGDVVRLERGAWQVAMTEPVLQGAVVKGQTRIVVLPPTEEDSVPAKSEQASHSSEDDEPLDDDNDDDFDIDESFLANSVLTPATSRFGPTPLTSPLSTGSRQKQFFPLGALSASTSAVSSPSRIVPAPLSHPIASDLLTPVPDPDEDDTARAFLSTADLGRLGLFSGDWAVLRGHESNDAAATVVSRIVRVFAAEGLVETPAGSALGTIQLHLPPSLLHNLLGPQSAPSTRSLSLEPASSGFSALQPSLPTAASLTLARIASPHSVNKLYQPLFLEGLKDYFQNQRRMVQKGDIIAVAIEEGRVRFGAPAEGKDEADEFELPASTSTPTAVVHFVVTALSLPPDLVQPVNQPVSLEEEHEAGLLGCCVDPRVTKLLQSGVEKSRVPNDAGWLGLDCLPVMPIVSPTTPASRLHDFVSASLASNAASYDLPLTVLLKGARGSGKRTLVHSVARGLGVHVLEIDAYDILGDTEAKTEGRLQALAVDKALACAPCILILRNIEALARKSQALETGQEPAMTTVLREAFSTIRSGFVTSSQPVIVLGTTTDVDKLPTGVIGLFKEELAIEAPGEPERLAILRNLTSSARLAPDVSLRNLAVQTAALVANDLVDLVRRAKSASAERVLALVNPTVSVDIDIDAATERQSRSSRPPATIEDLVSAGVSLTLDDFTRALDAARSSYSESIGAPKIPNVTWDDVGGLANVKSDILDTIQLPLEKPELFADGLKKRSGILLYGPPGTGKTLLAKAVATSCSLNFFSVKGPELLNMYIGESEANVRRVFQRARDAKPCVIFFDELDSVAPKRGNQGDSGGVMDRIVSQLLAELDGMSEGKGGNDVFVIGATNRPDLLDPALLRPGRFDRMLYLGISETHEAQLRIIEALTRKFKLEPGIKLERVAEQCPFNYTGADFYALCSDAMLKAMSRKAEEVDARIADLNSRPPYSTGQTALLTPQYYLAELATPTEIEVLVGQQDFEAALAELIPSVSPQELSHYKQVRAKFATETMNSDDKMEKKKQQQQQKQQHEGSAAEQGGSVRDLIERTRPLREVKANGMVNGHESPGGQHVGDETEDEDEQAAAEERRRRKGKGKAVEP
ncbi:AAA family ATPase peroxin 6 [Sporobolomyces koalae]|uniref:AAA family ATPase peroxin 6 n=1 Tax=Sporobolomyces koalae TaxID=500713 RepID=UPI003175E258